MSKTNKGRRRYTAEFKESVLKRLEPPTKDTVSSLAEELGISRTAIYTWRRTKANDSGTPKPTKRWSPKDKFHVVLETSTLTEQELAAYCRRKGLFVEDVKAWRDQCIKANASNSKDPFKLEEDLREEKQKTKSLERELRRKEKHWQRLPHYWCCEKAQAIWGTTRKTNQRPRSRKSSKAD